jgi:hypothetical protein
MAAKNNFFGKKDKLNKIESELRNVADSLKNKAIYTLDVPVEELGVTGISCHYKMFRLLHELSKKWPYPFERVEDWLIATPSGSDYFSRAYFTVNQEDDLAFVILRNRGTRHYLAPKHKQLDYLICSFDVELLESVTRDVAEIKNILFHTSLQEKNVAMELVNKLSADLL